MPLALSHGFSFLSLRTKRQPLAVFLCGETGIRTPDWLVTNTRFPGAPLQPLEHLSLRRMSIPIEHPILAVRQNGVSFSISSAKVGIFLEIGAKFSNFAV